MVLELKAPETDDFAALIKLWPSFAVYVVSFAFLAIYWINHHAIMMAARQATASLIWANNALLFCLSLIPFATAYVGRTHLSVPATTTYAALQFVCGLAFMLTFSTIVAQRRDDAEFMAAARARRWLNLSANGVYLVSILVAAISPASALALFLAVAVAYVVPGLFNEAPLPRAARTVG
jgi:uncharacterized membrane protein